MEDYKERARQEALANSITEENRRMWLERAHMEGVKVVHVFDREFPMGGLTVAFRKANEFKSGYMVDVAVVTCSPEDSFSKKIGTEAAIRKFFEGFFVELPLLVGYSPLDINLAVKNKFTALYNA